MTEAEAIPPPLLLRYAARSDIGLVRQGNEDSGYAGGHMLVVADGMGGHAAGELASATTVATFAELDRYPPGEQVLTAMADAVDHAHDELSRIIAGSPDFAGMGTTLTALSWEGDRVALAHVGDSRAYLLRDNQIRQLTKDHTYVQSLVDAGRITPTEAAVHEKRNLLMKALDGVHHVEPDLSMREVKPGDRFLLCSDGLSGVLNDDEIAALLSNGDPTGAVTALVEKALERGAPDNVTCVVADLVPDTADNAHSPQPLISTPVVVGAAAELRNRDRLPGIDFPEDAQPDPERPAVQPVVEAPPVEPELPARKRHWIRWTAAALVLTVIAVGGFTFWVHTQYFVGSVNGKVGIYQGISGGPGENGFSKAIETSSTAVDALPNYQQESVNQTIHAQNLEDARTIVAALDAQAVQCATPPIPVGCPANAGTTVGPK